MPATRSSLDSNTAAPTWACLRGVLSEDLDRTGQWHRWASADPSLDWPSSLDAAAEAWRAGTGGPQGYQLIAVLTRLGSRRGGDDNDAALAVVVLLEVGIGRLAGRLHDVCGVDDVRAAVWEEVKYAEPQLGNRAPRFLLKRAQQRLLRPAAGLVSRKEGAVSLDALGSAETSAAGTLVDGAHFGSRSGQDEVGELQDLLDWARGSGVLEVDDTELLTTLVAGSRLVPEPVVITTLSQRRGVVPRTIRRRRADAVRRLRDAIPDYLSATA